MSKLIIANWKMNPRTSREAMRLAGREDFKNAVVAPPFLFLQSVGRVLKKASLGAQDLAWADPVQGPFTGEISAKMLKDAGVEYVIVGHSERRALGETDDLINKKVKAALAVGLKVILCVGEPKRELGIKNNELRKEKNYVRQQLLRDLKGIHNSKFKIHNSLIIAYEPVWAIGTGRPDKPASAVEMVKFIKHVVGAKFLIPYSRVLYGGSVNSKNIAGFMKHKEIDGALIGGASLKAKEFEKIVRAASF